jgi:predicted ATP-grasp superfamily ATP-dependent carboligase
MAPRPTSETGVVVPAIGTASSTAALRSLGRKHVRTVAVSERVNPPGFDSKYCDEAVTVPSPTRDLAAYEESLLSLLTRRDDVRTVLPFREADVYVLARNREVLADHLGTPWPSLETLRGAQDRVELFAAAERAGVGMPTTRRFDEWDDWDREAVLKPRYTLHAAEYDDRFEESHTQSSSTRYLAPDETPDREEIVAELGHVPLVQEYVPTGDEYGFFALYDEGEAVATFQHRQRRGWQYAGGPSAYREAVDIPELEAAGLALLDELDWHGVAMVEFLRNPETGEFVLMEVNPRFWSSLPFTVQAGVDFPHLYLRQADGERISESPAYEVGAAGHLLRGELLHLHSVLTDDYPLVDRPPFAGRAAEIAASLVRDRRFDYLSLDDPGPFVRDVRNALAGVSTGPASASTGSAGSSGSGPASTESSGSGPASTESSGSGSADRSTGLRATLRTMLVGR